MTSVRPEAPAGVDVELLAQIVQVAADGVFCQDVDGMLISWNPAAERVYGHLAQDVLGLHGDLLMPAETRGQLQQAHEAALAGERVERFDTQHLCRDGSRISVNVSVAPLRDRDGRVVAVATTVADVTERVELAAELARTRAALQRHNVALTRSNRDLEQFAYVASHDLSEPLRVMTGYVEQIERRYDGVLDDRGRRYMQHIVEASRRMRALIDDLLEYSRFLRAEHDSELVDTGAVLARVLDSLSSRISAEGARVEVGELPAVWSAPQQLESLLLNLVSNGVKFTRPDAPAVVSVAGTVDGAWVTLTVDDNGIGIAPEYRERVFRMFQRLHVREAYGGTGIGLAIAQQIVELHGGRIWAEDSPAGGARFCVTLPALDPQGGVRAVTAAPLIHILLVEDNIADVELTLEALEEAKFANDVIVMRDGAQAVDYLHRRSGHEDAARPDLIILDLNLPKRSGHEVLADLKADPSLRRIPVAILTTSSAESDVLASYDLGANCFLTKPVDVGQFLKVVQSIEDFWFGVVRLPPR